VPLLGGGSIKIANPGNRRPQPGIRPLGQPIRNPVKPGGGQIPGTPWQPPTGGATPFPDGPLPPAPYISPTGMLLGAAAVLAGYIWGLLNPPKGFQTPTSYQSWRFPVNPSTPGWMRVTGRFERVVQTSPVNQGDYNPTSAQTQTYPFSVQDYGMVGYQVTNPGWTISYNGNSQYYTRIGEISFVYPSGALSYLWSIGASGNGGNNATGSDTGTFIITSVTFNGEEVLPVPSTPYPRPPVPAFAPPAPLTDVPHTTPITEPQVAPLPEEVPPLIDAPPLAPTAPDPGSTPAPYAPRPGTSPSPSPLIAPVPLPSPKEVPNTQPLPSTGKPPAALPAAAPAQTPTTQEQIGTLTVGQPGTAPPATLQGIAEEVGKIEQKTAFLAQKAQQPIDTSALEELLNYIRNLLDASYGSGAYSMQSPCERDPNGVLLPPTLAEWPGGIGQLSELNAKLDALAQVLQFHKNQRQPACGKSAATGAGVMVRAQEI